MLEPGDPAPSFRLACDFRDNLGRLEREGVAVFGVSKDSLASHERFREKHDLPFVLLSDEDNAVAKAYGAYGEKNLYGKKTMGTIRSTYLVDEKGKIAFVWTKVKVDGHVEEVLSHIRGDSAPRTKRPEKKR
jgi:peroxiredoxin Q/BCP